MLFTAHWVIPLTAAIATASLALIVNRTGARTPVRTVFTFLAGTLVLWNLTFFVLYAVPDRDLAFRLTRILRLGGILLPAAVLNLQMVLLGLQRERRWWPVLFLDYGVAAVLLVGNAVDKFVLELREFAWGFYSVGGRLYDVYTVYVVANFVLAFVLLAYGYRTSKDPRTRLQLKFWLLGCVIALPLGLTHLLPVYGVPFYPLGNLGNAAWATIMAYAIVRHRLMDVDLVLTKGVAYALVALILIAPTFAATLWLQKLSFGQIHPDFSFAVLVMLIGVGVMFPRLRTRAESRVEQSLFREKHEYRAALVAFARSIVRILERERLLRELAVTLSDTMQLDRVAVALFDETKHGYFVRESIGVPPADDEFGEKDPLIMSLARRQEAVLREELEASTDRSESSEVAETCRRNGWEVCVPLSAGGKLTGLISLGRKRNLDAFFIEDLELLGTLAAQASVALENARLYEELKRSQDIIRRADRLSALGTLAAGIAHEIRNPLVSIQTFFQLAPQRLQDQEFLTEFLRLTSGEVKRITDLITELLSFAKSPSPSKREVNLNDLVEGVVRLIEPQVRKSQVTIRRELGADVLPVRADQDQLKQVFLNILLNAAQAIEGGGAIVVHSGCTTHQGQTFCQVQVTDSGSGIPEELIDHIFDPFFTTKERGTGLGLAIAHQIVTEHGGFITVQSQPGVGTTFFIHFRPAEGGSQPFISDDPPLRAAVGGRVKHW